MTVELFAVATPPGLPIHPQHLARHQPIAPFRPRKALILALIVHMHLASYSVCAQMHRMRCIRAQT
ncbi:MAG: hypothetical protein AAB131_21875, partial [Actinomycetota bacterium]